MKIIRQIYPSIEIKRKPPANLQSGDGTYFGGPDFSYKTPVSELLYYKNVFVSQDGIIIKNFIPQKELIVCYKEDFKNYRFRYLFHVFIKHRKVKLPPEKNYILIFDNYSGPHGFYHWLSDGLTRLVEIPDIIKDSVALVPYYFKEEKFYNQTLNLFGIDHTCAIEENTFIKVKHLLVSKHIAESGNFHPVNVEKLRKYVWHKIQDKLHFSKGRRIYISRANANRRFVLNEPEVEHLLKQFGFQTVFMEDYDFSEQVSVVYNADIVVGIHGAALALIHFMKPDSKVLEFRKQGDNVNCAFFSLADVLDISYYYQFCNFVFHSSIANNFDLIIDLEKLKQNIEQMLNSKE